VHWTVDTCQLSGEHSKVCCHVSMRLQQYDRLSVLYRCETHAVMAAGLLMTSVPTAYHGLRAVGQVGQSGYVSTGSPHLGCKPKPVAAWQRPPCSFWVRATQAKRMAAKVLNHILSVQPIGNHVPWIHSHCRPRSSPAHCPAQQALETQSTPGNY